MTKIYKNFLFVFIGERFTTLPGYVLRLIDSASAMIYISSDLFADEIILWETYDEVDTVSGDGVFRILVIREYFFFDNWKLCLYFCNNYHKVLPSGHRLDLGGSKR